MIDQLARMTTPQLLVVAIAGLVALAIVSSAIINVVKRVCDVLESKRADDEYDRGHGDGVRYATWLIDRVHETENAVDHGELSSIARIVRTAGNVETEVDEEALERDEVFASEVRAEIDESRASADDVDPRDKPN